MTLYVLNKGKINVNNRWISENRIEELFHHLMSVKTDQGRSKYETPAECSLHRIPNDIPTSPFIINCSDLSSRLNKEPDELSDSILEDVVIEVISWIYESMNKEPFLLSMKGYGLLQW